MISNKVKIPLIIFSVVIGIILIIFVIYFFFPGSSDYGAFLKMRRSLTGILDQYNVTEKKINTYFNDYTLELPPLYGFMFKTGELSLFLKSYTAEKIDTATINQLEIGRKSNDFFDFTFMVRPPAGYTVPFFHGDALKALPGVKGALYMDFYSLDPNIDVDVFFGPRIEKIKKARELVAPYFKSKGFGELTPHLNNYKSKYRLEILEPRDGSGEEKKTYFELACQCFTLYAEAYLESLALALPEKDQTQVMQNARGIEEFVDILYKEDIAAKMGKMIFPREDFDIYFFLGFWGIKEYSFP